MRFLEVLMYEGFTLESFLKGAPWGQKGMTTIKTEPYKRSMMMLQGQPEDCTCTSQTKRKSTFCQGRSPADSNHPCKILTKKLFTFSLGRFLCAPGNCASKIKCGCCEKILDLNYEYLGLSSLRKYLC